MGLVSVFLLKGVVALLLLMGPLMVSCDEKPFAAVQGVVYCKPCKYQGIETLLEASPIPGAVVKMVCQQSNRIQQTLDATTDKNGYFFIHPFRNYTSYFYDQCKVFLVSSPNERACNKVTDLHQGRSGAYLYGWEEHPDYLVFTVGPFAFEPNTCHN